MKRAMDIAIAAVACMLLAVPALLVALVVRITSRGPALYWSARVGRYGRSFSMPKFRIIVGEMTLVGPRPALHSQETLIRMRRQLNVDSLRPGLTGWAQVNGRDNVCDEEKARLDSDYLKRASLALDAKIIMLTAWKVLKRDDVSH